MTVMQLPDGEPGDFSQGEVYFIGNATTLIRFGGITILTDPAFLHRGAHVDLGHGIWARREVEPACQVADLPPVDLIVLSHYHGDHFDDVAARDLDKDLPVISTADAVGKLRPLGFANGYPLDTWGSHRVERGGARLTITAMPALHAADEATAALLMPVKRSPGRAPPSRSTTTTSRCSCRGWMTSRRPPRHHPRTPNSATWPTARPTRSRPGTRPTPRGQRRRRARRSSA